VKPSGKLENLGFGKIVRYQWVVNLITVVDLDEL
jgi:hypothetical protein